MNQDYFNTITQSRYPPRRKQMLLTRKQVPFVILLLTPSSDLCRHPTTDQWGSQAQPHCIHTLQSSASLPPRSQSIPLPAQLPSGSHSYPLFSGSFSHLSTSAASPCVCLQTPISTLTYSLNLCCTHQLNPLLFPLALLPCRFPFKFLSQAYRQPEPRRIAIPPALLELPCKGHAEILICLCATHIPPAEHKGSATRRDTRLSPW